MKTLKQLAPVVAVGTALFAVLLGSMAPGRAAPDKKGKKKAHLEYRATYERALMEARIRNVPVFVSRHKDF